MVANSSTTPMRKGTFSQNHFPEVPTLTNDRTGRILVVVRPVVKLLLFMVLATVGPSL